MKNVVVFYLKSILFRHVKVVILTHCILGNISFLSSAHSFQNQLFEKEFFQEYHQNVKQFGL